MTTSGFTLAALNSDDFGYQLLLFLHILAVIVGFGSTFVWPKLGSEAKKRGGHDAAVLSQVSMNGAKFLTEPPIYLAGIFGLALAIAGERMDEAWTGISLALFILALLFSKFVHMPNLKRMNALAQELDSAGPPPAGASGPPPQVAEIQARGGAAARNGGILHLAFVVILVLMVWQPN